MLKITDTKTYLVADFEVTILEVAGCLYTARADWQEGKITFGIDHLYILESEAFDEIVKKIKSSIILTMQANRL